MFLFASPFILSLIEELKEKNQDTLKYKWSTLKDTVNFYDFKVFIIFKSLIATIVFRAGGHTLVFVLLLRENNSRNAPA